jgi:FkbM family methyltransferase
MGSLTRRMLGAKGNLRRIRLREAGRVVEWYVPDDALWLAVKDNLILREYEQLGISLSAVRGCVIDAGANVGLFCMRAALYADRVIALEPHPEVSLLLRLNAIRNAICNIDVRRTALWTDSAGVQLTEGPSSGAASLYGGTGRKFDVESATLDDLVSDVGEIELVKLDIEGAEFPVLLDCRAETLSHISAIVAEIHLERGDAHLPALVERLEACGFTTAIREPPIHYWIESMRRTISNWPAVMGLTPLKMIIVAIYSAAALGRVLGLPFEPEAEKLKLLFAVRRATAR